jgi:hypothetical protein
MIIMAKVAYTTITLLGSFTPEQVGLAADCSKAALDSAVRALMESRTEEINEASGMGVADIEMDIIEEDEIW